MPGRAHRWDLSEIAQWKLQRNRERRKQPEGDNPDLEAKRIKAKFMTLRYLREEGAYMPIEDYNAHVEEIFQAVREAALSIVPTIAAQTGLEDERARLAVVEDRMHDYLRNLSKSFQRGSDPVGGDAAGGAAAGGGGAEAGGAAEAEDDPGPRRRGRPPGRQRQSELEDLEDLEA